MDQEQQLGSKDRRRAIVAKERFSFQEKPKAVSTKRIIGKGTKKRENRSGEEQKTTQARNTVDQTKQKED